MPNGSGSRRPKKIRIRILSAGCMYLHLICSIWYGTVPGTGGHPLPMPESLHPACYLAAYFLRFPEVCDCLALCRQIHLLSFLSFLALIAHKPLFLPISLTILTFCLKSNSRNKAPHLCLGSDNLCTVPLIYILYGMRWVRKQNAQCCGSGFRDQVPFWPRDPE
jgi:hypothetical protein